MVDMAQLSVESIYTGTEGRVLRPVPAGPAAVRGTAHWQRLLAVAEWSPDDKEDSLTVYNMEIQREGSLVVPRNCSIMRRFVTQGSITALQVADLGQGEVLLVTASGSGELSQLRFRLPMSPEVLPEDLQWLGVDDDEVALPQWMHMAGHEISDVDISRDASQVVSVSRDGGILLASTTGSESALEHIREARPTASYRAVKWASASTFVTAGTTGGLEVWDCRSGGGRAVARSPQLWGSDGGRRHDFQLGREQSITCLDVHPSRPHLCVTGCSSAFITIWDLRFQTEPVTRSAVPAAEGNVTAVHFDTCEPALGLPAAPVPSALSSTDDGGLFSTAVDLHTAGSRGMANGGHKLQGSQQVRTLLKGVANGIPSFGLDPVDRQDLFCLGGSECLMYAHRH